VPQTIYNEAQAALAKIEGLGEAKINIDVKDPPDAAAAGGAVGKSSIPGVKTVIAVGSGKGGVGKSTVAGNLAIALSKLPGSPKVGLCDCDLYGPSIALMFGQDDARPLATEENEIIPIEAHGIKLMSMGFLLDDDSPVIVRGPLATRYTQQFLRGCAWGELDYLVLDLPPGTGDIQLTIVQTVAVDGVVIVTTPQEMALIDARKAASMFSKVNVPVLGVVENMSYFLCPSDGEKYAIFGEGGGAKEAERLGVPLLGQIPIEMSTRESGDNGTPVALGDSETAKAFASVAEKIAVE
jgi:ATP-binding protein involved in chromosome partitioning